MADTPKKKAPAKKAAPKRAKQTAMKAAEMKTVRGARRAAPKQPAALREPTAAAPAEQADFGIFFRTIGAGLVDAQKEMDAQSLEYLKSVAGKPHLLPSIFRIPRATAQMKFALTKKTNEKFDVLIFGTDSAAETMHQQSVEFEVISAPPPAPGPLAPYGYIPVLSADGRDRVFGLVRSIPNAAASFADLLREPLDQVLILGSQTQREYLLIRAGDGAGRIGVWYLIQKEDGAAPVLATLRAAAGAGGAPEEEARSAFAGQARAQAEFLGRLREPGS